MEPIVDIFCCYAHEDQWLLNKLKAQLTSLQRQELIRVRADTDISAGKEWKKEVQKRLETAHILLLLVSPDFMESDHCYSIGVQHAIERHERGEARVIPVILRPVHWHGAPFGKLLALPTDGKPVTDWQNLDSALFDVAEGIRKVAEELRANPLLVKPEELTKPGEQTGEENSKVAPVAKKTSEKPSPPSSLSTALRTYRLPLLFLIGLLILVFVSSSFFVFINPSLHGIQAATATAQARIRLTATFITPSPEPETNIVQFGIDPQHTHANLRENILTLSTVEKLKM